MSPPSAPGQLVILPLAPRPGYIVGELTSDPLQALTITYDSEATDLDTEPLTTRIIQAFPEQHSNSVDPMNARA